MNTKKIFLPCFLAIFFLACQNQNNDSDQVDLVEVEEIQATQIDLAVEEVEKEYDGKYKEYIGYWVGWFEAKEYKEETDLTHYNFINISIENFKNDSVFGRSIVAGNDRPFAGVVQDNGNGIFVGANEPGDDKYDGVFSFTISDGLMEGEWDAYDENLKVTKRVYSLEPREFEYDPNNDLSDGFFDFADLGSERVVEEEVDGEVYEYFEVATVTGKIHEFNPSIELIPEVEIANMHKGDLQILRNSIYAKHGYSFKNRIFRYAFEWAELSWYIPVSTDVRGELTEIEIQNIELMTRYEEYAEDYYDVFGR